MKKLLFLIPTLQGGGAEKVLVDLVNNLDASKYDVTVQTYLNGGVFESNLNDNIRYKTIISTNNKYLRNLIMYLISFILPSRVIYKLFIKGDYDIEVAYLQGVATKTLAESSDKHAKRIAFVHSDFSQNYLLSKFYKTYDICLKSYQKFDQVVFVSNNAKEGFEKTIGKLSSSLVLHNVLDQNAIIEQAKERISIKKSNKFLFVSVGRLSNQKGYDRLIEAAALLNRFGYDYEIWIVGEGNDRSYLEKLIETYDIHNIKLLGFKRNPYPYMALSDMFICSSRVEGYSTVVTEALVLQIPVLTTDCSGMNEILDNGKYGMIVENSTQGIYQGMKSILNTSDEFNRYLMMAKKRSKQFSINRNISKYEKLFEGENSNGD